MTFGGEEAYVDKQTLRREEFPRLKSRSERLDMKKEGKSTRTERAFFSSVCERCALVVHLP